MNRKIIELKVPKNLVAALWVIAFGLILNGFQLFTVEPVSASNGIQKVQICDPDSNKCAKVGGFYSVRVSETP